MVSSLAPPDVWHRILVSFNHIFPRSSGKYAMMHSNCYFFYSECNLLFYYHILYSPCLSSHNVCVALVAALISSGNSSAVELVESAGRLNGEAN